MNDSYVEVFGGLNRVLLVLAHPDDNEVVCGGLVARLRADGKEVRILVTTSGGKGNMDQEISESKLATIRLQEQIGAAKVLGVPESEVFNLAVPDGELEASLENIGKVAWHIRDFKPDIVITHNPHEVINTFSSKDSVRWVNHRDHRHTGLITTDAVYPYSRDTNFFPEHLKAGLSPHEVSSVAYSDMYESDMARAFDVTDYIELKRKSLSASKSVIPADHVDNYIDECQYDDGRYYEVLGVYLDLQ